MRKNEQPCSPPLSAVPPESLLGAAQITGDRGQIRKFWVNLRRYDKGNPACRPVGTEQFRRRRHRRPHRGVQRCSLVARLPRCTRRHPAGKARCFGRRQQHPLYGGFSRNAAAPHRPRPMHRSTNFSQSSPASARTETLLPEEPVTEKPSPAGCSSVP